MASGLFLACVLAASGATVSESDGEMEIFIQHSDGDVDSEPMEIFIEHSEPAPIPAPAAPEDLADADAPIEASAKTTSSRAFLATGPDPTSEVFADGLGSAWVKVADRVRGPRALNGDSAELDVSIRVGVDTWRVTAAGVGQPEDPRSAGFAFGYPVDGGVRLGDLVLGRTGIPFRGGAAAIAAFSLFGTARVEQNGQVVAHAAPLQVVALTTGIHADDDTHRRLPNARGGDVELIVFVPQLPRGASPHGFLLLTFEDLDIGVQNHRVRSANFIPTVPTLNPEELGVGPIPAPAFLGAARDFEAADLVPLPPVALISTPRPLNSAPADRLPLGIDVEQGGPEPLFGGAVDPSFPADTLPQGIAVLQGSPQPLIGGAVDPSRPADTLVLGIAPLNTQPLDIRFSPTPLPPAVGPGGPLPQPSNPQVLPPVPPLSAPLPLLAPPVTAVP